MKYKTLLLSLVCGAAVSFSAYGQKVKKTKAENKKATKSASPSGKVDISDLENKYWAPKDTDFSVVQNRTYTKAKRFSLNLAAGRLVNDRYNEGEVYSIVGNYYFSERNGVELSYTSIESRDNQGVRDLVAFGGGVKPDHGKIKEIIDIGYNYIPFYAKMSVLGKRIIYFDMVFTPKIGMAQYDQQIQRANGLPDSTAKSESAFTYGFDISQMFFINEHITVRADLKNRWFDEKKVNWRQNSGNVGVGSSFNNTTMFQIGIQYFF